MAFDLSTAKPVSTPQEPQPAFDPTTAQDRTWGQVARESISNIPSSAGRFASGIYEAVAHPLQTGQAVLDIGAGGLQAMMPQSVLDAVERIDPNPQAAQRARGVAGQVGDIYRGRYGSESGFKEAIATDPVGVLSDASTVLTGGAMIAPQAGKLASVLRKGAELTNPITPVVAGVKAAGKAVGSAVPFVTGMTTGAGSAPIKEAYKAGKEGGARGSLFAENMRGRANMTDVLDDARFNLEAMNRAKQAEYRYGTVNLRNDKTVLDLGDIDTAINDALGKVTFKGQVKNQRAADAVSEVKGMIDQWKTLDPAQYHTPEGLDALKQQINGVLEGLPFDQKTARSAVGGVHSAVKDAISKQAPEYTRVMRDYSEASALIKDIEKALSLGKNAAVDTSMRKLQSIMRNNVNTNYGQRATLVEELERQGGRLLQPQLAGQALGNWTPRGIQTATTPLATYGGYAAGGIPGALGTAAASSPRLIGEAAYGAGRVAGGMPELERIAQRAGYTSGRAKSLANILYQTEANTQQ